MKAGRLLLAAVGIVNTVMLAGCGGKGMEVSIQDGMTETIMSADQGATVGQLLSEAEITLDDRDEVIPAREEVVTGDSADIEIKRYARVNVTVEDADNKTVELTGATVADALNNAGIELLEHDYVNHDVDAYLTDGMDISVTRRLEVMLTSDGESKKLLTQAKTVGELLAEQDITLGSIDRITPKQTDELKEGTLITIKRVEKRDVVENEPVEFETVTTYSNSLEQGKSKITKQGINGEKKVTYEVTYVDGKEESREAKSEEIIKEAVNQEVVMGSKPKGKTVVSKQAVYDCDGSGHGFYIITYSDGSVEYKDF